MAKIYPALDDRLIAFLQRQPMFFVGTAPLDGDGHLNLSPKGLAGTFTVFGPTSVGYLDYTGSGVETIAHLTENGRIVLMFCSFDGAPNIVRLHGTGRVVRVADAEFEPLRQHFDKPDRAGERSIIVVELHRIADACGFSVPLMDYRADRDVLDRSHRRHTPEYFERYWTQQNAQSIDGLPGVG